MQKYLFRKKMHNTSFNSWSLSLEDSTVDNIFYVFFNATIMETIKLFNYIDNVISINI